MASKILVTGATGHVGGEVIKQLLVAGQPVRALLKSDDRSAVLSKNVEAVSGDLNKPETLIEAMQDVENLFLLPGYNDMPGVLAVARQAGVKHVVQLSGRSAATGNMNNAIAKYMIESENAAMASGLSWTILRPNAFMTSSFEWATQIKSGDTVRAPFGTVRTAIIDPQDIGAVAAAILMHPKRHEGKTYAVSGPEALTRADQVRILGKVLGRKLTFVPLTNEEARTEMGKTMPAQYVDALFDFYITGSLDESQVLPTVQELIGRPPRRYEQWVVDHLDVFQVSKAGLHE